jgi:hypothetical protein
MFGWNECWIRWRRHGAAIIQNCISILSENADPLGGRSRDQDDPRSCWLVARSSGALL